MTHFTAFSRGAFSIIFLKILMEFPWAENGKKNAREIARKLKGKKIDVAIHTRLSRSKETLKIALKFHPDRGKWNNSANVIESYKRISEIKGISLEETEKMIFNNYQRIFGKV